MFEHNAQDLDLFEKLYKLGPCSSENFSKRIDLDHRYIREWLLALSAAGYITYDIDTEFLAKDARELRKYIGKIQPSVDLSYDYEDQRGNITTIDIPVGINFFWPDATI